MESNGVVKKYPEINLYIILLILPCAAFSIGKSIVLSEKHSVLADFDLDPYFSYAGINTSLVKEEPEMLDASKEVELYKYMIKNFYIPRSVRLEASINPMPVLGVYMKHGFPDAYARRGNAHLGTGLIRGITAGFPDPGALSFFLGNTALIVDYEKAELMGMFFGGGLLNYGTHHILNNTMYQDHWLEAELKLKGKAMGETSEFSTSYRFGAKYHFHDDIKTTAYVSIKRDVVNRDYIGWSLFKNSSILFRFDLATNVKLDIKPIAIKPAKITLMGGKKVPFSRGSKILSLELGAEWVSSNGYERNFYESSLLRDEAERGITSKWNIIIRPNVKF